MKLLPGLREKWKKLAERLKKKSKKQETAKPKRITLRHKLEYYMEKAGIKIAPERLAKIIFNVTVVLNLFLSFAIIFYLSKMGHSVWYALSLMAIVWIIVFLGLLIMLWLLFYVLIDLKIFKRRVDIETVLPDFLQLTSANIRAGMQIDRALWYSIRPQFGVLSKEIEVVAKDTMAGEDLQTALRKFADKYDSVILKRAVSLLIEGVEAGGEIGELLNRIATNIEESQLLRKELAASVTTYVIFITFTTILAAPFLFALASQLLGVVTTISSTIEIPKTVGAGGLQAISFSAIKLKQIDFKIFAVLSLTLTSLFSAMMISIIRKGEVKPGMKYIPIFIVTSITLFFILSTMLSKFFSGFF